MQLYKINQNGNKYCGPSVISAVAGIGTKEAAAIIRAKNCNRSVKATYDSEIRDALKRLGFNMAPVVSPRSPAVVTKRVNLAQWAKTFAKWKDVYLVLAGRHWILLQDRHALCGKTIDFVRVGEHPNARCFVTKAFRITPGERIDPATVIPVKPAHIATEATARKKAKALAVQYGITCERDLGVDRGSPIWVYMPAKFEHLDSHEEHYLDGWVDVFERVKEYAALIAAVPLDAVGA